MTGRALLTPTYMLNQVENKGQRYEDVLAPIIDIVDLIAFDCYSNESLPGYRTPEDLFAIPAQWARRANEQLLIAEWGMQIDSGKPAQTDLQRATNIRKALDVEPKLD